MKCAVVFLLAIGATSTATDGTPVQKVITLLTGMLEKGKKERHDEQVQFASFQQFCADTSVQKKAAIKKADAAISMLTADISKYTADDKKLGKEVTNLDKDTATWQGDSKAVAKVRDIERKDYETTHKDYTESIDAIQRAVAVMKKQMFDRKQGNSLAQVEVLKDMVLIPAAAKRSIDAFLSQSTEVEVDAAPEANGYESASGGIVQMLEKLTDKFTDERTTLEKEEANAKHSFAMLQQDLSQQIAQAKADRGEKAQAKAKALQGRAQAKGELQDTSSTKSEDVKFSTSLNTECRSKSSDFEQRQTLRAQEIEMISKATEILAGTTVTGFAQKHAPALMQMRNKKATAFSQLRSTSVSLAQEKAQFYLSEQAKQLNSRVLSSIAMHVKADGFDKVKKMIKDLIVRLMESANEEAEHKGWCDTELATNEQTRKEKTAAVDMLSADMDELKASISQIGEDVAELSKAVSELDTAMSKQTKMRREEKASNKETVQDAQDAQTALAQALIVLKDFYSNLEGATLVQKSSTSTIQAPAFEGGGYQGMGGNGGIVGMLEVIESDFARLGAETSAAEATAQKNYDKFMTESKADKASKVTASEHKTAKKQNQEQSLITTSTDLVDTQKVLDAALSYYDKLKPSCIGSGSSYDDRVARRKEEVESLQEALKILTGEDMA